ncbi:MAG: ABC transporter permease [Acidobacteriota bacterium]|nr:ABC transporter permease [Blastocatellia bacterium]MDW8238395.1 ABC transporter permease [Acidobacteriota bacterium]
MFFRVVAQSFRRQRRSKLIATLALMLGTSVIVVLLNITLDVEDKVNRELKAFGANLLIVPKGTALPLEIGGEDLSRLKPEGALPESHLPRIKEVFWRHNILAFAPILDEWASVRGRAVKLVGTWFHQPVRFEGGAMETGMKTLNPLWHVEGQWVDETNAPQQALVGQAVAKALQIQPGQTLEIKVGNQQDSFYVTGVLTTGGAEDDQIFTTLAAVQKLTRREGQIERVLVSALTTPESKVYERLGTDPHRLPPEEFERWMCTPFVSSIAHNLREVFPMADVKPIQRVVESEARILQKMKLMMILVAALALVASALAVMSTMMTTVLERRTEIGLMKAIGSTNAQVVVLFLTEASLMGLIGGFMGCGLGIILAKLVGSVVFGSSVALKPIILPLALGVAVAIALIGCAVPARQLLGFRPVEILRNT